MDYYYALLDSYKLLKKRKLKLTINEQEGEGMGDAELLTFLLAGANGHTSENQNKVTSSIGLFNPMGEKGKNGEVAVPDAKSVTGTLGQNADRLVKGGVLVPYEQLNQTGKNIIDQLRSGEGGSAEKSTDDNERPEDPEDPAVRQVLNKAAEAWTNLTAKGAGKDEEVFDPAMFPGLKVKKGRAAKSVVNILAKGSTITGFGGDKPEEVVQQMMSTPCDGESEEDIAKCNASKVEAGRALESLGRVFQSFKDQGGNIDINTPEGEQLANELRRLNPQLATTDSGVKFGEYYVFYKQESSSETDVLRNTVDQLNAAAEKYNEEWDGATEGKIPLVESQARVVTGKTNRAMRGTAAEVIVGLSVTMMNLAKNLVGTKGDKKGRGKVMSTAKKEVTRLLDAAKKKKGGKSTLTEIRDMFKLGVDAMLGDVLAKSDTDVANINYVQALGQFFADKGMDDKVLKEFLTKAGQDVGPGLVLCAFANRHFDYQLFGKDLIPENVQQEGQTDSTALGAKVDVGVNYDAKDCEKVKAHYDSLLSDEQRNHYALGDCSENDDQENLGVGMDDLTQKMDRDPEDKSQGQKCYVGVEIKTLDNLRSTKGYGQSSNNRMSKLFDKGNKPCSNDLNTSDEKGSSVDFIKLHERRMRNCGVSDEAACKFSQTMDKAVEKIRTGLNMKEDKWGDGKAITLKDRKSLLSQWATNKGGVSKLKGDAKLRYEGALRHIQNKKQPKGLPEKYRGDAYQATAIGNELWQIELGDNIEKNSKKGKITGDAQDYLLSRLHLGAGSTEETGKVGRMLDDDVQTFGLNNAEIMGCIGGVKSGEYDLVRKGNTYKVLYTKGANKGKSRMEISAERGNFEISGGKGTGNKIEEGTLQHSDDLLLEFLKGQQMLLNQLMKP
jgi:hypothetical protein